MGNNYTVKPHIKKEESHKKEAPHKKEATPLKINSDFLMI